MNCPICHSTRPAAWLSVSVVQAADHFCPASRDVDRHAALAAAIAALWQRDEAALMHCPDCGFRFADPHVAGDARYYGILHEQSGYPSDRWEYAEVARACLKSPAPVDGERHALDIGAGDGSFFDFLPAGTVRHATEMSDSLRDALARRGVDARADLNAFVRDMPGRFSLVTLFQVIEHLADPRDMLRSIRTLLAPGGMLALSTPEGDEQQRRYRVTRLPDMPPNHISIYGNQSMGRLLVDCGFDVVAQRSQPASLAKASYALQLRTLQRARARPKSLAGLAQRVRSQSGRRMLTAAAGVASLPGLLRHWSDAKLSCNFLTLASPARPDGVTEVGSRP